MFVETMIPDHKQFVKIHCVSIPIFEHAIHHGLKHTTYNTIPIRGVWPCLYLYLANKYFQLSGVIVDGGMCTGFALLLRHGTFSLGVKECQDSTSCFSRVVRILSRSCYGYNGHTLCCSLSLTLALSTPQVEQHSSTVPQDYTRHIPPKNRSESCKYGLVGAYCSERVLLGRPASD
jgi:hypothetical protein